MRESPADLNSDESFAIEAGDRFFEARQAIVDHDRGPGHSVRFVREVDLSEVETVEDQGLDPASDLVYRVPGQGDRVDAPRIPGCQPPGLPPGTPAVPQAQGSRCSPGGTWPSPSIEKSRTTTGPKSSASSATADLTPAPPNYRIPPCAGQGQSGRESPEERVSRLDSALSRLDLPPPDPAFARLPPPPGSSTEGGRSWSARRPSMAPTSTWATGRIPIGLALGLVKLRPVVLGGAIVARSTAFLSLTCDRRVMTRHQPPASSTESSRSSRKPTAEMPDTLLQETFHINERSTDHPPSRPTLPSLERWGHAEAAEQAVSHPSPEKGDDQPEVPVTRVDFPTLQDATLPDLDVSKEVPLTRDDFPTINE